MFSNIYWPFFWEKNKEKRDKDIGTVGRGGKGEKKRREI